MRQILIRHLLALAHVIRKLTEHAELRITLTHLAETAKLRKRVLALAIIEAEDGQQGHSRKVGIAELDSALQHGVPVELEPLLVSHALCLLIIDHLTLFFDADTTQRPPHLLGLLTLSLLTLANGFAVAINIDLVQQVFDPNLKAGPVAVVHVVEG